MQVTTDRPYREDIPSRIIMIQWFFLDGIKVQGAYFTVIFAQQYPIMILSDPA